MIKRIIPAVASTNAAIASLCALEVFKVATSCANPLQNYLVFNDVDGIYTYAYEAARNEDCLACSRKSLPLTIKKDKKLQDLINVLVNNPSYQMRNPGMTTMVQGKNKTLYMPNVMSIEEATRPNLKKSLDELGLVSGSEVVVADATTPAPIIFKLTLED